MPDMFDVLTVEVEGEPSAARALKVLDKAKELGWIENPYTSLVVRLTRADAEPFFARWDLAFNEETGRKSWRFAGARARNGQPLNYSDIFIYLEDPSVIYPDSPEEIEGQQELDLGLSPRHNHASMAIARRGDCPLCDTRFHEREESNDRNDRNPDANPGPPNAEPAST